jgi:N-acetylglucosamine-6-phosphate deacetylase
MTTLAVRRYDTGEPVVVEIAEGRIASVQPLPPGASPPSLWVAPALFDIQINGALGHRFGSPELTAEEIWSIVTVCHRHGLGGLCPTLITDSTDNLVQALRSLSRALAQDRHLGTVMPCFHLEGPWISPEDGPRGAHSREHVRPPDWDEFLRLQDAAQGRIRLLTLAPEWEQAVRFIEKVVQTGVVVALGHTAASEADIQAAIDAGARLSTHLGNGCAVWLHRHENVLWYQLAADQLWCSLICDGHHLPPAILRCLVRCKTPDRVLLTCDASPLAGMPPGQYTVWGQKLEVLADGRIVVAGTPYLAGSSVFTDTCVRQVIAHAGVSLSESIAMASARPRSLLGLPQATLQPGQPADLILFTLDARGLPWLERTLVRGTAYPAQWE